MTASSAPPLLLPEDDSEWAVLHRLADRLRELSYNEEQVAKGMGIADIATRNISAWPAHVRSARRQREQNPAAILGAFFLMEEQLEEKELRHLLGDDAFDLLLTIRWIAAYGDKFFFRYYLYPALDSFLLTDGHQSNPDQLDQVYALGPDSYTLTRLAPRFQVAASLDHCTGSGVQAVLGAAHAERAFGLDINPRALAFSRLNANWNRRSGLNFLESDCYTNVNPETTGLQPCRFDLITANPPFVPTPDVIALFRGGGVSGEDVTERIVHGVPEKLTEDGVFSMVTQMPLMKDVTFFQRCESWLASDETWSIVVLNHHLASPAAYIQGHLGAQPPGQYGKTFEKWLDAYDSVGMLGVTSSQIFVFRSAYPWRIDRAFSYSSTAVSSQIEAYIKTLRACYDGSSARFRLNAGIETVIWSEGRSRVYIEWQQDHRWWEPQGVWLDGEAAQVMNLVSKAEDGVRFQDCEPAGLRELISGGVLTLRP